MKKLLLFVSLMIVTHMSYGQLSPAITSFLQNTTQTGTYYMAGNSTAIGNNILVNCQKVEYSTTSVYVTATGIPSYPTGPFQDGNPSQASNQNAIYRIPLAPTQNTGTPIASNPGNIGIFVQCLMFSQGRSSLA